MNGNEDERRQSDSRALSEAFITGRRNESVATGIQWLLFPSWIFEPVGKHVRDPARGRELQAVFRDPIMDEMHKDRTLRL